MNENKNEKPTTQEKIDAVHRAAETVNQKYERPNTDNIGYETHIELGQLEPPYKPWTPLPYTDEGDEDRTLAQ